MHGSTLQSGIELQPLVEEAGEGEEVSALLRSPTVLVGQPVATVELMRDSELLRASEVQVHVLDTETSFSGDEGEERAATPQFYDPELDVSGEECFTFHSLYALWHL